MPPYCEKHKTYFNRTGNFRFRWACFKCMEEKSTQRGVDQLKWEGKRS